jgi:hypothetical protein
MTSETQKRCEQLSADTTKIWHRWIDEFPDNHGGKVRFALTLANAFLALRHITPGLEHTGADFLAAVKAGTEIWVEEGEPEAQHGK